MKSMFLDFLGKNLIKYLYFDISNIKIRENLTANACLLEEYIEKQKLRIFSECAICQIFLKPWGKYGDTSWGPPIEILGVIQLDPKT